MNHEGAGKMSSPLEYPDPGKSGKVKSTFLSGDGNRFYTGHSDGTANVWDTNAHLLLVAVEAHTKAIRGITATPDGATIITASDDQTLKLWATETLEEIATLQGHTDGGVNCLAVSADGARLYTGGADKTARIWDLATHQTLHVLTGHTHYIWRLALSADGRSLVTGSGDKTARVWDATTGDSRAVLTGHSDRVRAVAMTTSMDGGERIYTGSGDGTTRIWDPLTPEAPLATLESGIAGTVSGSSDGLRVYIATDDGIQIWSTVAPDYKLLHTVAFGGASIAASESVFLRHDACMRVHKDGAMATIPSLAALAGAQQTATMKQAGEAQRIVKKHEHHTEQDAKYRAAAEYLAAGSGSGQPGSRLALTAEYFFTLAREGNTTALVHLLFAQRDIHAPVLSYTQLLLAASDSNDWLCIDLVLAEVAAGINNRNAVLRGYEATPRFQWRNTACEKEFLLVLLDVGRPDRFPDLLLKFLNAVPLLEVEAWKHGEVFKGTAALAEGKRLVYTAGHMAHCAGRPLFADGSARAAMFTAHNQANQATTQPTKAVVAATPFCGLADGGSGSFLAELLRHNTEAGTRFFGTLLVATVVQHKWKQFGRRQAVQDAALYVLSLLLTVAASSTFTSSEYDHPDTRFSATVGQTTCGLLGATGLLALRDLAQEVILWRHGVPGGKNVYFRDLLTWLRLVETTVALATSVLFFAGAGGSSFVQVLACSVFFKWFGLFYYMQPIPKIGAVVHMIMAIFAGIVDIMVVLGIAVLAYANQGYLLSLARLQAGAAAGGTIDGYENVATSLYTSYKALVLVEFSDPVEFDDSFGGLTRVMSFIASVLSPVVVLNMLIARMGDTYERVQETAEMEERRLKARLIVRAEMLMGYTFFKRAKEGKAADQQEEDGENQKEGNEKNELQVLFPDLFPDHLVAVLRAGENEGLLKKQEWAGMLSEITTTITTNTTQLDGKMAAMDDKMAALEKKLDIAKLDNTMAAMDDKMAALEKKLDMLIKHAEANSAGVVVVS